MKKSCLFQLALFVVLVFVVTMFLRGYIESCRAPQEGATMVGGGIGRDAESKGSVVSQKVQGGSSTASGRGIEGLSRLPVSRLMIDAPHIRGLAVNGGFFYVSSFDPAQGAASVYKIDRGNHSIVQTRTLREDGRYQSGGLYLRGGSLLVPLAGDEGDSRSSLLFLDGQHLDIQHRIEVEDRIRAVVQGTDDLIYGVNSGSSLFYVWTREGKEVRRGENYNQAEYGDMEFMQGSLVCAGADGRSGVIDIIDPYSFSLLARHRCYTRTPDEQWVTGRGFAFFDGIFYFVPDDGHFPTLMKYVLDGMTPSEYIPYVDPEA